MRVRRTKMGYSCLEPLSRSARSSARPPPCRGAEAWGRLGFRSTYCRRRRVVYPRSNHLCGQSTGGIPKKLHLLLVDIGIYESLVIYPKADGVEVREDY